jgi:hypothetical protein
VIEDEGHPLTGCIQYGGVTVEALRKSHDFFCSILGSD